MKLAVHSFLALLLGLSPDLLRGADVERRKYEQGPLAATDFLGAPDQATERLANTSTELRHEYRYRYRSEGQYVIASLESITLHAYIWPGLSWNKRPRDLALLDHEQGHADIAHIESLKARLHFHKTRATSRLHGRAMNLKDAVAALDRIVNKQVASFIQAMRDADVDYDRSTSHGVNGKQAEYRRVQQETIKRLEAEWAKVAADE